MDRSSRNLAIITLVVLAIFLALNQIVKQSALLDWWTVLLFLLLAVLVWFYDRLRSRGIDDSEGSESDGIEPVIYNQVGALPDTIELVAPNPGTVIKEEHTHPPVEKYVHEPAPSDAPPVVDTLAPPVATPSPAPAAKPEPVHMPPEPMKEDVAREPMPSSVIDAKPAPVKAVTEPPPATVEPEPAIATPGGKTVPADASVKVSATPAAEAAPNKNDPNLPMKAAPDKPDDLKIIEGIGPKMEKALKAAGITTFAQLSGASEAQIHAAIDAAGMRFAPSVPTWAEQASYAANGDFVGLEAFQKTLVGGRKAK